MATRPERQPTELQPCPRPVFTDPEGGPAPAWVRLASRLLARPGRLGAFLRQASRKYLVGRLPPLLARYEDGRAFLLPAGDRSYSLIFIDGEWEPAESALLRRILRDGDLALDVGANHGWHTLVMAGAVGPHGAVSAVEPLPAARRALAENLRRSGTSSVQTLPVAVGAEDGETTLHSFAGLSSVHSSEQTLGRDDSVPHRVPRTTVDGLLAGSERAPALVKLDIEGAELNVLRGAHVLIGSEPAPIWMLEVNYETSAAFGYRPADLLAELHAGGDYAVYRLAGLTLGPDHDPGTAPQDSTWVCVPVSQADRIADLVGPGLRRGPAAREPT